MSKQNNYMLSLALGLLVLFQGSLASRQQWQFHQDVCQLNKLNSLEPDSRVEFEGGRVEAWDPTHEQFQCAGVAVVRKIIEPNGLLLPSYSNAAQLVYVVQGKGYTGIQLPGCPETYQESQGASFQGSLRGGGEGGSSFQDQHQKVRRFRQGDVLALPAGVSHWCYNDGNEPVVVVVLLDTANTANQLDFLPRNFYLAGNPEEEFKQLQGRRGSHFFGAGRERIRQEGQQGRCNNVFCGMDTRLLAEAFNIDEQLASRLQNKNDGRGNIIRVEGGLEIVRPPRFSDVREEQMERHREEQMERHRERGFRGGRYANGMEETLCNMRFKENIGNPERSDIFTPEAGRLSALNSHKLPVLRWLQLSAERGVLYRDGLMLPHWNLNAHSIMYVIRGQARVQVVDHQGQNVFDGQCQEGQVLVIPQNFAVVKRCESDRFEWVSFKTNDNAMINPLAGKTSAFRALPAEVLANAFQVSLEDARRLKFQRHEATIASSRSSQSARFADDA